MDVQRNISEIFEPLEPDAFHLKIADFRWRAIFSTNYDFVVERAYQKNSQRLQQLHRLIRDKDDFAKAISSLDHVPYLKIHGCLSVVNDENLPLILATEEYAKHKKNRQRMFDHLKDFGRESPIIFCGYDLSDPNIQQIFYDLGDRSENRAAYVIVKPGLDSLDNSYWSQRRVTPIAATFEEFLNYLDSEIPKVNRKLSQLLSGNEIPLQKFIQSGTPSDKLQGYINLEFEHVREDITGEASTAEMFYRGADSNWESVRNEYDVRRRVTDSMIIEAVLDAGENEELKTHVVKGYAGSGKSITLRRVAWESAVQHGKLVFWLSNGGLLRSDLVEEVCEITGERVFIFIENAIDYVREVEELVSIASSKKLKISLLLGARTNEWNVASPSFDSSVVSEYELRDLSDKEIDELLGKLEKNGCLGALEKIPDEKRKEHFVLTSQRQLLVALHEATSGKSFEEIVLDEYNKLQPDDAKLLYLDVCTLHRFGVGVRAGLISRVTGINFSEFKEKLLAPLEHVVGIYHDAYSGDFAYRSRHALVADLVFRGVFDEPEERSNQIVRVVSSMNVDYESDRKAFSQLVRGRDLAELFSDRVLADRVFEAALDSGGDKGYVEHQRSIFEMNHPGGSLIRAEKSLAEAESNADRYAIDSILNTRANLLRRKAAESTNRLESNKYRADAENLLIPIIRKKKSSHAFHTLGLIYLDELKDLNAGQDAANNTITSLLKKIENNLETGLATFPSETYLLSLEASVAAELNDSPRALEALVEAVSKNPYDQHLAIRLSRVHHRKGSNEDAQKVLSNCIDKTPTARRAKYQLAMLLMDNHNSNDVKEIGRLLRSGFSDGDTNYDTQFWYARHEYLYGNRENSQSYFDTLRRNTRIRSYANPKKSMVYGTDRSPKRFTASIKNIRDAYCFAHVSELNDDLFIHCSECASDDWKNMRLGDTVTVSVNFNSKGPHGINLETG